MGGGPKHVLGILSNIDRKIFEPFLICPPGYLSAEGKLLPGVEVFNFNPKSKFDIFAFFKLRSIIHSILSSRDPFGPAIIHSHGPRAGLMARWGAPPTAKTVHTEHNFNENYHLKNPLNELFQKRFLKRQNNKTDLIIAVSTAVKNYLINSGMAPKTKVVLVPNGINIKSKGSASSIKSNKSPIIGAIGNLNYQKGYTYLLDAMPAILKKYPMASLEIIGEGEDRSALEDQIKKLKLQKHVTLLGHKNILDKYFKHWSLYVMPSVSETFGIAILEAMQAGVPVVATRVGGIPDIITNNKNGLLVEPKNANAIANGITQILDSPATASKLRREGTKRVEDFDWKKVIKQLEEKFLALFE